MTRLIKALAIAFSASNSNHALVTHSMWHEERRIRICPERAVSPVERARITIETFLSPVDGFGDQGITELQNWVDEALTESPGSKHLLELAAAIKQYQKES